MFRKPKINSIKSSTFKLNAKHFSFDASQLRSQQTSNHFFAVQTNSIFVAPPSFQASPFVTQSRFDNLPKIDQQKLNPDHVPNEFKNHPQKSKDFLNLYSLMLSLKNHESPEQKKEIVFRLMDVFGNYESSLQYLKKMDLIYLNKNSSDSNFLTMLKDRLPKLPASRNVELWQQLAFKYLPNKRLERILSHADKIEIFVEENKTKLEQTITENITQQITQKFSKEWNDQEQSIQDKSETDFILSQQEQNTNKRQSEILKSFHQALVKQLGITTEKGKSLSQTDKEKIEAFKLSEDAKQLLQKIETNHNAILRESFRLEYKKRKETVKKGQAKSIEEFLNNPQTKLKSQCKNAFSHILDRHTDLDTLIKYGSQVVYRRALENLQAAEIFFQYGIDEEIFNKYLSLTPKNDDVRIPKIKIDGTLLGYDNYTLEKLDPSDPIAAILSEPLGCCQGLGKIGEMPTIHGITSLNGGFYVIRSKDDNSIVSGCWAWRTEEGLVFDSIECQRLFREGDKRQMVNNLFSYLAYQLVKQFNIPKVLVGTNRFGGTPDDFKKTYWKPILPIDYHSLYYRDSTKQVLMASTDLPTIAFDTLLCNALDKKDWNTVQFYLKQAEIGTISLGMEAKKLVMKKACERGEIQIVSQLLKSGIDPNVDLWENRLFPLTIAANAQQLSLLKFLLEQGSDSTADLVNNSENFESKLFQTFIYDLTVRYPNFELVKVILENSKSSSQKSRLLEILPELLPMMKMSAMQKSSFAEGLHKVIQLVESYLNENLQLAEQEKIAASNKMNRF